MKSLITLLAFFWAFQSFSSSYFSQINNFNDKECPTWTKSRFKKIENYIFFGVRGAKNYGYTHEFPISREAVDYLWCALVPDRGVSNESCPQFIFENSKRPFAKLERDYPFEANVDVSYLNREEQMNTYLHYVNRVVKQENIARPNVGVVLEILSRLYLQELSGQYPKSEFKIASGVEYKKSKNTRTLGELDIIVYDRRTCIVTALGESKASSPKNQKRSLKKAKSQINRFRNFIKKSW